MSWDFAIPSVWEVSKAFTDSPESSGSSSESPFGDHDRDTQSSTSTPPSKTYDPAVNSASKLRESDDTSHGHEENKHNSVEEENGEKVEVSRESSKKSSGRKDNKDEYDIGLSLVEEMIADNRIELLGKVEVFQNILNRCKEEGPGQLYDPSKGVWNIVKTDESELEKKSVEGEPMVFSLDSVVRSDPCFDPLVSITKLLNSIANLIFPNGGHQIFHSTSSTLSSAPTKSSSSHSWLNIRCSSKPGVPRFKDCSSVGVMRSPPKSRQELPRFVAALEQLRRFNPKAKFIDILCVSQDLKSVGLLSFDAAGLRRIDFNPHQTPLGLVSLIARLTSPHLQPLDLTLDLDQKFSLCPKSSSFRRNSTSFRWVDQAPKLLFVGNRSFAKVTTVWEGKVIPVSNDSKSDSNRNTTATMTAYGRSTRSSLSSLSSSSGSSPQPQKVICKDVWMDRQEASNERYILKKLQRKKVPGVPMLIGGGVLMMNNEENHGDDDDNDGSDDSDDGGGDGGRGGLEEETIFSIRAPIRTRKILNLEEKSKLNLKEKEKEELNTTNEVSRKGSGDGNGGEGSGLASKENANGDDLGDDMPEAAGGVPPFPQFENIVHYRYLVKDCGGRSLLDHVTSPSTTGPTSAANDDGGSRKNTTLLLLQILDSIRDVTRTLWSAWDKAQIRHRDMSLGNISVCSDHGSDGEGLELVRRLRESDELMVRTLGQKVKEEVKKDSVCQDVNDETKDQTTKEKQKYDPTRLTSQLIDWGNASDPTHVDEYDSDPWGTRLFISQNMLELLNLHLEFQALASKLSSSSRSDCNGNNDCSPSPPGPCSYLDDCDDCNCRRRYWNRIQDLRDEIGQTRHMIGDDLEGLFYVFLWTLVILTGKNNTNDDNNYSLHDEKEVKEAKKKAIFERFGMDHWGSGDRSKAREKKEWIMKTEVLKEFQRTVGKGYGDTGGGGKEQKEEGILGDLLIELRDALFEVTTTMAGEDVVKPIRFESNDEWKPSFHKWVIEINKVARRIASSVEPSPVVTPVPISNPNATHTPTSSDSSTMSTSTPAASEELKSENDIQNSQVTPEAMDTTEDSFSASSPSECKGEKRGIDETGQGNESLEKMNKRRKSETGEVMDVVGDLRGEEEAVDGNVQIMLTSPMGTSHDFDESMITIYDADDDDEEDYW